MSNRKTLIQFILVAMALSAVSGCVRRRMMVRTNPAGASVYVDKQLIGTTPAATSFTYYGTREIEVVRDGYRTEKVLRTISPPWYEFPGLDFISETLWPWELRDERIIDISMVPEQNLSPEELNARANSLRIQAAQGVATSLPPTAVVTPDFRNGTGNATVPPVDPTLQPPGGVVLPPNTQPVLPPPSVGSPWRPGQLLQNLIQPGGQPVESIPEVGVLDGGGYRPTIEP